MTNTNIAVAGGAARPPSAANKSASRASTDHLSGTQKAAVIIRVLLAEGVEFPACRSARAGTDRLTRTLASLKLIDRPTMCAVVEEFVDMLEQVGMSFPDNIEDALTLLDGKLDAQATAIARNRRAAAEG